MKTEMIAKPVKSTGKYKQTEIGLIPEDWDLYYIGELFNFRNGLNKAKEFFGHGTPIVNYMDVFRRPYLLRNNLMGKVAVSNSEIKSFEILKGDVFFTRTSETVDEIGMSSVLIDDVPNGVFSGFLLRARPISDALNLEFKKYCFLSNIVRKQITSKSSYTTRALTNGRLLSMVKIPVPPKKEQTAIAEALSDVDAMIASLEKLIDKKKKIKQGAMQELLRPKEGWVKRKLGDCLSYEQPGNYIVKSTDYNDNNQIPVLTAGKSFILGYTDEEFGIFTNLPVIIFDDFTTASKFVSFPFKVKSSAMKILQCKGSANNIRFLFELMQGIDYPMGVGDHKRHWIGEYQQIEISVPEIKEQNRIANLLQEMDTEITLLESKLSKSIMIKQGMMQNLLTGKIRLV